MREEDVKKRLIRLCHLVERKGLVMSSGGNISARCGDKFFITPTGRALGELVEEDLVVMNINGEYEGNVKPSKEYIMHLNCFRNRPEINVVLHVHSTYAVAVSCLKDLDMESSMKSYTPGYVLRVDKLPAVPYMKPGSLKLAEAVGEVIAKRNSVLLAKHGVITVGATEEEALNIAEEIEENAKLICVLSDKGEPLSEEDIEELRKR